MVLLNKILDERTMTEEWLVGSIVPLFKNMGNANDVNNYRESHY